VKIDERLEDDALLGQGQDYFKETAVISGRNQLRSWIMIAIRGLAILLVLMIIAFALYLLFGGHRVTVYTESPQSYEVSPLLQGIYSESYLPALLYLIAAAPLLVGLTSRDRLFFAWIGLILLFVFSLCFLFSSGGVFIPFTAILLVLLIIIQWFKF